MELEPGAVVAVDARRGDVLAVAGGRPLDRRGRAAPGSRASRAEADSTRREPGAAVRVERREPLEDRRRRRPASAWSLTCGSPSPGRSCQSVTICFIRRSRARNASRAAAAAARAPGVAVRGEELGGRARPGVGQAERARDRRGQAVHERAGRGAAGRRRARSSERLARGAAVVGEPLGPEPPDAASSVTASRRRRRTRRRPAAGSSPVADRDAQLARPSRAAPRPPARPRSGRGSRPRTPRPTRRRS